MSEAMDVADQTETLPVLPLRDIVVFPHMIVPLFVGREKSVRALDAVMEKNRQIVLATQRQAGEDEPAADDIYDVGVVANVLQLLKLPDGTVKVLVEGVCRTRLLGYTEQSDYFEAIVAPMDDEITDEPAVTALARAIGAEFEKYVKLNKVIPQESLVSVAQLKGEPSKFADAISGHLSVKIEEKQGLLELTDVAARLERIFGLMKGEISVLQVERKIKRRVKNQMERTQREYYLNEQMKAIQRELGEGEDGRDDISEIEKKIQALELPEEVRKKAEAEVKKLRQMAPMSAEATVVRNFLDWIVALPWSEKSVLKTDLAEAEAILDADHYGLEKIKERIVEFLAVHKRSEKLRGPILCLVGPPGVGKTSLGKSIARATGREFIRISLGGVRDEAEIRGHRRTYIGSMPGKIIQSLKKASTINPLFMLDEIDKLGLDFRGDPASALLEVLDPEQNNAFNDHYMEVDYDLSNVMFVTTANTLNMPMPLMDRMEVIRLSGYTEDEKVEIARRHLLPKQQEEHGLIDDEFLLSDNALLEVIRTYTREAGVRNLERELARLCRKSVTQIVKGHGKSVSVDSADLADMIGVARFKFGLAEEHDQVGVTTGLAYTEVGGDLLSIEALSLPGKGRMKATGKLGEVMKESIEAAASYVRANAPRLGVRPPKFEQIDIHVHVPEGATPKDGPSAGVAVVTSIVSVLTAIPVRREVAMTGEITLRGNVLPIGGLKEKLLSALRGGIKKVLIPKDNAKDLPEIPDNVKEGLEITPVSSISEVLAIALSGPLTPIEWDPETDPLPRGDYDYDDDTAAVRH